MENSPSVDIIDNRRPVRTTVLLKADSSVGYYSTISLTNSLQLVEDLYQFGFYHFER